MDNTTQESMTAEQMAERDALQRAVDLGIFALARLFVTTQAELSAALERVRVVEAALAPFAEFAVILSMRDRSPHELQDRAYAMPGSELGDAELYVRDYLAARATLNPPSATTGQET